MYSCSPMQSIQTASWLMLLWLQNRQVKQFRKQVGGDVCICSLNNRKALVHKLFKSLTRTVNNEIYNEQQPWLWQGLYTVKLPFLQYGSHPAGTLAASHNEALVEMLQIVVVVTAAWKVLRSCQATSRSISLTHFSGVPNGWALVSPMDARSRWGPPWAQCMLLYGTCFAATSFVVKNSMMDILPAPPREKLRAGVRLGWKRCSTPFKKLHHLVLRDNLLN